MKFDTAKSLERLVASFTAAIEATGTIIPDEIVALIGSDPFKACEELNRLALSCHALTPESDAEIAALYENMDALDARSEATPTVCDACAGAFARVHVEPAPEPEVSAEIEPEAETTAEAESETLDAPATIEPTPETEAPKRARKTRVSKKNNEASSQDEPSSTKAAPEQASGSDEPFGGEVLSVDQAMLILGISRPKLTKLIDAGTLPAYKKGRSWQISAAAVLDLAATNSAE